MTRAKTALLLALTALVLVPAARAAASVEIRGLDTSGYPTVRLTVVSSKPVSVKPALAENGQPVVGLLRLTSEQSALADISEAVTNRTAAPNRR